MTLIRARRTRMAPIRVIGSHRPCHHKFGRDSALFDVRSDCRGAATTPPDTISLIASSTESPNGITSSRGTKIIGPVNGEGGLGINSVRRVVWRPVTVVCDSFVTKASE